MGYDGVASGYSTPIGFRRLTSYQRDPGIRVSHDDPIARRSIPPLAPRHGEETGGTSKADEGVTGSY